MNPIVGLLAGGRRRGSSDADQDGGGLLSRALATTYDRAGRKSPCSVSRALGDAENSILNCETQEKRCEIENGSRQEADQAAGHARDRGNRPRGAVGQYSSIYDAQWRAWRRCRRGGSEESPEGEFHHYVA